MKHCPDLFKDVPKPSLENILPPQQQEFYSDVAQIATINTSFTLSSENCLEFIKQFNPIIVDVRPAEVFKSTIYPKGAINIPLADIRKEDNLLPKDKKTPILLIDNRGKASLNALLIMLTKGYKNVKHYYRYLLRIYLIINIFIFLNLKFFFINIIRGIFGWWQFFELDPNCQMKLPDPINSEEELFCKEFEEWMKTNKK